MLLSDKVNKKMKSITCNRCGKTEPVEFKRDPQHGIYMIRVKDWILDLLRTFNREENTIDLCGNCTAELLLWIQKGK